MKKFIVISLMCLALSNVEAQSFRRVRVNYVKMDHITLNAGMGVNLTNPLFKFGGEIDYTSMSSTPGMSFQLNGYSSHNEINDMLSSGIEFNVAYMQGQWGATFSSEAMNDPNFYYNYYGKFKEAGFGFGPSLTVAFSDQLELVASACLNMGFLFFGDTKAEAVRVKDDQVYSDPSLNEWHEHNADESFSLEFGLYAKLGAYYKFSDHFAAGVVGMYNLPFLGTAVVDGGEPYCGQNLGYNMVGYVGKIHLGSLMLSLRIDLD